jgi:dihydroorotate dehydrogenase
LDKDEAIINRYGFNSDGMMAVQRNLRAFENRRCDFRPGLLGVNVGECVHCLLRVLSPVHVHVIILLIISLLG